MHDDLLRLDQQLCFALYATSRALTRAYGPLLEPLGVTYPQYLVLLALWQEDGRSVKELGASLSLDSGTLTPLLKRMERMALLTRARDADDERVVRVHLTPAGHTLRAQAHPIPPALACQAGFNLTLPHDLARLNRLRDDLHAMLAALEAPP